MSDASTFRILDASLNRATEGLRVVEDYVRFVLDDAHLTEQFKHLRHDLAAAGAALPWSERHATRDTQQDVGTAVTTPSEGAAGRRLGGVRGKLGTGEAVAAQPGRIRQGRGAGLGGRGSKRFAIGCTRSKRRSGGRSTRSSDWPTCGCMC